MPSDFEPKKNAVTPSSATVAVEPGAPKPAIGAATCDLAPEPAANAFAGTCDLDPGSEPVAKPDATCDVPAAASVITPLDATCDVAVEASSVSMTDPSAKVSGLGGNPHKPEDTVKQTCDFDEGSTPTDHTADFDPKVTGGKAVQDTEMKTPGRHTSLRTAEQTFYGKADTEPSSAPRRAGRFVFKKFHAKGGMGEIWLVEDSDIGRPVALKRMLNSRQKLKDQFLKEARVTGQLEHPGVIPVHELSIDEDGQPFYVMKFVHGKTLKSVIQEYHKNTNADTPREVEWLRLLNVFIDLCQTIAYAHSRGVIHRDIKPDNVMVGAYGETLVLDWGLAKVIGEPEGDDPFAAIRQAQSEDGTATVAGSIKGSPYYLAPEAAAGEVDKVDQVSDVFLLGGTLYEMVTGKTPRWADKMTAILQLARTEAPKPPRQLDPSVPRPLDAICRKALALKKEDRYQAAAELAEDVQRYMAGEPVSAYQETRLERTWRWVKRHRTALTRTAAIALILAIGMAAFVLIGNAEARRAQAQAETADLKARDDAHAEIKQFRALLEEARFYAASADPVATHAPALDAAKVEVAAKAALAIAEPWGPALEKMPLEDQRDALKKDLYNLLLELAQLKSRQPTVEHAKEALTLLERAAAQRAPTQSFYRLRARCLAALGQDTEAAADRKREADPQTPTTAMDHYLVGEQYRVESLQKNLDDKDGKHADLKGLHTRRDSLHQAINAYRRALRSDPDHYWSHFQLGTCYSGLGSYAEAAEALGACVALMPKAPWGYSARGLALAQLKDRQLDAEADLDQALRLDEGFRPARLHRAVYFANQKKYADAEKDFAFVLAPPQEKRLSEAAFARGQMYLDRQKYDQALADFDQVVADRLNIRTVYLHRARLYLAKEMPEKVLENLNLFLASDGKFQPESPQAYEQRGRHLRLLAGEFPSDALNRREAVFVLAMTQLQTAIKRRGDTASLYDEIGTLEQRLAELQPTEEARRRAAALDAYTKAIQRAPKDKTLRGQRAWAYIDVDQLEKAREDFIAAVELDPSHADSYAGLGYTEAMLKDPVQARRHAALATLHGAGDYLVLHNVACVYGALSKMELPRAKEHQDTTLDHLRRAVDLWKKGDKKGPNEIRLILNDAAFPPELRARAEFKRIVEED